eukprot:1156526-Pelagomonas_calceolata.AAC.2
MEASLSQAATAYHSLQSSRTYAPNAGSLRMPVSHAFLKQRSTINQTGSERFKQREILEKGERGQGNLHQVRPPDQGHYRMDTRARTGECKTAVNVRIYESARGLSFEELMLRIATNLLLHPTSG